MISEYFKSLGGDSIVPVISLIVFFVAFIVLLIRVFRLDKKFLTTMGNIPLDTKTENQNNFENKDEVH